MLTIQRASAGSGKTYTLARNFILDLIAWKDDAGKWHIRTARQIEDALQHTLAITFTNKATNEMKQRIVNNLALIARAAEVKITDEFLKSTPYLKDFHTLTGASYLQIANAANEALNNILNNYSKFKISTIDSFFQEILRTFAYEANLKNSYQLEIDSSFVNDSALDAAIHELDTHPEKMGNAAFWLKIIIKEEAKKSQKWNPFNKSVSRGSIYSKIKKALDNLESEDFKEIKETLDDYFKTGGTDNLKAFYETLKVNAQNEREEQLNEVKSHLSAIDALLMEYSYPADRFSKNFIRQLDIIAKLEPQDEISFSFSQILNKKTVFLTKYKTEDNPLDKEAVAMYEKLEEMKNPDPDSYYMALKVYGPLLPYLGLIGEVRQFISDVLETNNLIQLSDTNYILRKIIGDDDTPFVFERLGNRIDHFLIDEFQDTSRMQWDILFPLVNEGVGKGFESLIIGDPKQSIYRFRNADHKLITDVVPKTFPRHTKAGDSEEENTNWRSHTRIVKFNNFFFKTLAAEMKQKSDEDGNGYDFNDLYRNVVQKPHNTHGKGYVEVRLFGNGDENNSDEGSNADEGFSETALEAIPNLVCELRKRGYRSKDICILVNTNVNGEQVVEALLDYNEQVENPDSKIDFISEESLLISSSSAVEIIIGVIQKLSRPGFQNLPDEEPKSETTRKYVDWNKIKLDYKLFAKKHSDLSPVDRILKFLDNPGVDDTIPKLLSDLPTPSLTSIVETTIEFLIDEDLRKSDALYLASFQDLVTEYSSSHPHDPASFLEWWKTKGKNMSVASPEDIDAVQIMTIHKSKGLEFKCVIVPFASDSMVPSHIKEEWRWVTPPEKVGEGGPGVLPVKTSKKILTGSRHENIYKEYFDQVATDRLNLYYVAFTRAKNELYIFAKEPSKNSVSINNYLFKILSGEILAPETDEKESKFMASPEEMEVAENKLTISFGQPLSLEEIKKEIEEEEESRNVEKHYFNGYFVNQKRPRLRSLASKMTPGENL